MDYVSVGLMSLGLGMATLGGFVLYKKPKYTKTGCILLLIGLVLAYSRLFVF